MNGRFVYMTTKDVDQARQIGRALVEARLAACVNIIPQMESCYHWQGEIVHDHEAVLIAKSRAELVPALIEKVRSLHSYTVPCVVALPILEGNQSYLDWIAQETSEGAAPR